MRPLSLPLFLLACLLLLESCSSGKRAFEQGDYYEAVLKSVNRLRQKPTHKKSREVLRKSYPLALRSLEKKAQLLRAGSDPFKWKKALAVYGQINHLSEEISHAPGALDVIPDPQNYHETVEELRKLAAEESYKVASKLLAQNTRETAKDAYFHFREVQQLVPGYKDVEKQLGEAEYMAILKVVVEQIPVPGRYSLSGDFFQQQVETFLRSQYRGNRFVRFYTPEEARRENLQIIDQYLQIHFDDFMVGQTFLSEKIETFSRDSVQVGEVKRRDGTKDPVYGTVKAKLKAYRKEVVSNGVLSMRIIDANSNATLLQRKLPGEFVWFSEWATYSGDERALSEEQLRLCELEEVLPPHPQDLFMAFSEPIFGQLQSGIREFYKRY